MRNLQPEIIYLTEKKLVGKCMIMSLKEYKIAELWRSFMPERNKIPRKLSNVELVSLKNYEDILTGNPEQKFEQWALTEVTDFEGIPDGMSPFVLKGGLYARFDYKGLNTPDIFIYIYGTWLPSSGYLLDNRPHFEVLGEKYKNGDPDSEEEIWIPLKQPEA
ncbi:MAG: GyrI-like domain-containing protein [Bacteroidia bacterium]|nr:GyrI-like domain-containing protein [Bacteroidia bacterium]